jgi:hypothetical protein
MAVGDYSKISGIKGYDELRKFIHKGTGKPSKLLQALKKKKEDKIEDKKADPTADPTQAGQQTPPDKPEEKVPEDEFDPAEDKPIDVSEWKDPDPDFLAKETFKERRARRKEEGKWYLGKGIDKLKESQQTAKNTKTVGEQTFDIRDPEQKVAYETALADEKNLKLKEIQDRESRSSTKTVGEQTFDIRNPDELKAYNQAVKAEKQSKSMKKATISRIKSGQSNLLTKVSNEELEGLKVEGDSHLNRKIDEEISKRAKIEEDKVKAEELDAKRESWRNMDDQELTDLQKQFNDAVRSGDKTNEAALEEISDMLYDRAILRVEADKDPSLIDDRTIDQENARKERFKNLLTKVKTNVSAFVEDVKKAPEDFKAGVRQAKEQISYKMAGTSGEESDEERENRLENERIERLSQNQVTDEIETKEQKIKRLQQAKDDKTGVSEEPYSPNLEWNFGPVEDMDDTEIESKIKELDKLLKKSDIPEAQEALDRLVEESRRRGIGRMDEQIDKSILGDDKSSNLSSRRSYRTNPNER